jgi:4-amino-4-deoxy-L-arabinose transferase-like glycosyltransferase
VTDKPGIPAASAATTTSINHAAATAAAAAGTAAAGRAVGGRAATAVLAPTTPGDQLIIRWFIAVWIAGGVLMLLLIARPDIQRTQEARVLGTAREMLGRGTVRDFLIPHLNGKPRLHKPPLAYWTTAASFSVFGVSDFSGRLPAALAAWLTVPVTFGIARRYFGARAAAFAAGALFGSVLFIRYGTLAETDIWTALFVTIAVAAMLRCLDEARTPPPPLTARFVFWAHLSAVATALTVLAKGLPAVYPILFLIGACAVRRRWIVLARWLLCGAPVTLVLLAAPWFIYITSTPEWKTLIDELREMAEASGHHGWFFNYFGDLIAGMAPWTGLTVLGVADAVRRARRDPRLALMLVWFLSILVPLCITPQKQKHYVVPALPPLAILTGWILDRGVRLTRAEDDAETDDLAADPLVGAVRPVLIITLCVAVMAVVGLPLAGLYMRHRVRLLHDVPLAVGIALAGVMGLWLLNRRGLRSGAAALAVLATPIVLLALLYWSPTTHLETYRDVAAVMRHDESDAGGANLRYGFYAQPENLALTWAIRRVIPSFVTQPEIDAALAVQPKPVLITSQSNLDAPIPADYVERHRFEVDDKPVTIYFPRVRQGEAAPERQPAREREAPAQPASLPTAK